MADWWTKLKRFNRKGLLIKKREGRFNITRTGYRFDRRFFKWSVAVIMLVLFGTFLYGLMLGLPARDTLYMRCPEDARGPCRNPFYLNCDADYCRDIESAPTIMPGVTIGTPPDQRFLRIQGRAIFIAWVLFALAIAINHFLYNRGKVPLHLEVDDERQRK